LKHCADSNFDNTTEDCSGWKSFHWEKELNEVWLGILYHNRTLNKTILRSAAKASPEKKSGGTSHVSNFSCFF
jgi:hypothetical protein